MVVVAATIVSAWANAAHAEYVTLPGGARAAIAAVPAISLAVATHLALSVISVGAKTAWRRPAPVKTPAAAVTSAPAKAKSAGMQWVLAHVERNGELPAAGDVAAALAVSKKSAYRYLAAAKEARLT